MVSCSLLKPTWMLSCWKEISLSIWSSGLSPQNSLT